MSFGLTATLLIRLDARMGEWETVDALASHCGVTRDAVMQELEPLVANGLVRAHRHHNTGDIVSAMCCEPEVTIHGGLS